MNENKWKQRLIKFGVTIIVFIAMVFCVTMLINLALNYLLYYLHGGLSLLHQSKLPPHPFKLAYLVTVPKGISENIIFMLSLAVITLLGHKTVSRITQRIMSLIPAATSTVEGSSRFATSSEIKEYLTAIPKGEMPHDEQNGFISKIKTRTIETLNISPDNALQQRYIRFKYRRGDVSVVPNDGILLAEDKHYYYVDTDTVNSFIIGTTRSGKDQLEVENTIRFISQCENPQSFIAFDMKGEMIENSYGMLKARNYTIKIFNLDTPELSNQRNLLMHVIKAYISDLKNGDTDFSHAIELIHELAFSITENVKSDPVWPECAGSLVSAVMIYLLEDCHKKNMLDQYTLPSVFNFFIELASCECIINRNKVNALDDLLSNLPAGHPAKMDYATVKFAEGEMRASVFATMSSNMRLFIDPGVAHLISGNDIDFSELVNPDKPYAIFMIIPDGKSTRKRLASLFVAQCYEELLEISRDYPGRVLPQRVRFILNELGNMPRVPDLVSKITSALGRNILFDLYVQSMKQLVDKYGANDADTIQGNCGNWVYLNSLSSDTNKYVSDQLGNSTLEYRTYNSDNGDVLDRSRMSHLKGRPLKTPNELFRMKFGEIIVIRQRCYPIHTKMTPFYKLKIPTKLIKDIIPKVAPVPLRELLYPVSPFIKAFYNMAAEKAADSKKKAADAKKGEVSERDEIKEAKPDNKEKMKLQGAINNINLLTKNAFKKALKAGDIEAMDNMVEKYLESGQISEETAEVLGEIIANSEK
jgi:type IV secretion system protein VirD4